MKLTKPQKKKILKLLNEQSNDRELCLENIFSEEELIKK